jgi:hypothetical protein
LEDWLRLVKESFPGKSPPYLALVGNKRAPPPDPIAREMTPSPRRAVDLEHMRAVSKRRQEQFAEENEMFIYEVSAKTGYRVRKMFQRVAADLAGVLLTRKDVEAAGKAISADIVQHPQLEDGTGPAKIVTTPVKAKPDRSGPTCSVQ